jgi:hypothetical protein
MKKTITFLLFSLFFLSSLSASDGDLIAIPHIEASGTSAIEAETARSMIEIGLVKAGLYTVIANNDIETILEAQAFTLTGCVDESCAIEVGKLLAADRICLGELVKLQDQYILNVRLINVSSGKTEKAESIAMNDITELQEASYKVAFAFSNQKYIPGKESGITEFGELYIVGVEDRKLTIFLDGKEKGETPMLLKEVPFGVHLLQVIGDDINFEQEINVTTKQIQKIMADPDLQTGNLILTISPDFIEDVIVQIDGIDTERGLLTDIKSGRRFIHASGEGWAGYGNFNVETGKTGDFTLNMTNETGTLIINREEAEYGTDTKLILTDSEQQEIPAVLNEEILLPAGKYTFSIEESDYETYRETVSVEDGKAHMISPELTFSKLFLLRQEHEVLSLEVENLKKSQDLANGIFWTGAIIGGLGLTAGLTSEIIIQANIMNIETKTPLFEAASTTAEAEALGQSIDASINAIDPVLRITRNISLIVGGSGALITTAGILMRPDTTAQEAKIKTLEKQINMEASDE